MKLTKAVFALLLLRPVAAAATDPAYYVCPLMGSMSTFDLSAGNTYPAIARPWGMNFWTPQTGKMGDGWQYTYTDKRIRGFKQTHQPSPWINDYGQFSLMPVTGTPVFDQDSRASWFSHKAETVTPYYYKVYLADHDVVAEMTPTDRAAVMRFTFPEGESFVVVDAFDHGSEVSISGRRVTGRSTRNSGGVPDNFANYFVVEFDRDPDYVATADGKELHPDSLAYAGEHAGAVIGFRTKRGEQVTARVASSFISPEQAIVNLGEVAGVDFDSVCAAGRDAWNDVLGRVEIDPEGADPDQLRTFYTCLYRSTLFPRKFYEMDAAGNPVHYSPYNGRVMPGYLYTDTGVWDTFRALFPLLNLLYPSVSLEMQEGFLNAYRESGFFPEWSSPGHRDCMVGNNSASVLADAWIKGIRVSDPATLWEGVVHGTNAEHPTVRSTGRLGFDYYNRLGYVPCDVGINESVARTLEYAYDDWCIYRLGLALGRPAGELEPYARRAGNYRNVFLPSASLMCGRRADGSFALPFSPLKWGGDFTEGNSWHYTWSVFHDPDGLAALMGGPDRMDAMLDSVFAIPPLYDDSYYGFPIHEIREMTVMNMGNYAHGNQPIQHMIYLYDTVGRPWKAQRRVRQVMDALYSPAPDGYCGDEDNGQTSAWYVFSALGFYPLTPGSLSYAVGSPLFRRATLTFEDGRRLAIEAPGNSPSAVYIRSASLNGRSLGGNFLDHNAITSGGTLRFEMSDTPDTQSKTLK
jgi:predicted alpha-1,2-mannosidase